MDDSVLLGAPAEEAPAAPARQPAPEWDSDLLVVEDVQHLPARAAELREQVGGYAIIDCPDLDDALKWAVAMPAARDCSVEVRAIVDTGGGNTGGGR